MTTTAQTVKKMAKAIGVSEEYLCGELIELGLGEVLSMAERMQHRELFDTGLLDPGEPKPPVTPEQLRQAYELVTEDAG